MHSIAGYVTLISWNSEVREDIQQLECSLRVLCEKIVRHGVCRAAGGESLVHLLLNRMDQIWELGAVVDEEG